MSPWHYLDFTSQRQGMAFTVRIPVRRFGLRALRPTSKLDRIRVQTPGVEVGRGVGAGGTTGVAAGAVSTAGGVTVGVRAGAGTGVWAGVGVATGASSGVLTIGATGVAGTGRAIGRFEGLKVGFLGAGFWTFLLTAFATITFFLAIFFAMAFFAGRFFAGSFLAGAFFVGRFLAGFFFGAILVMFVKSWGFWSTGQESQLCPPGSSRHRQPLSPMAGFLNGGASSFRCLPETRRRACLAGRRQTAAATRSW